MSTRTCIGFSAIARSVMISAIPSDSTYVGRRKSFSAIARSVMISATSALNANCRVAGFSAIARSVMISASKELSSP